MAQVNISSVFQKANISSILWTNSVSNNSSSYPMWLSFMFTSNRWDKKPISNRETAKLPLLGRIAEMTRRGSMLATHVLMRFGKDPNVWITKIHAKYCNFIIHGPVYGTWCSYLTLFVKRVCIIMFIPSCGFDKY